MTESLVTSATSGKSKNRILFGVITWVLCGGLSCLGGLFLGTSLSWSSEHSARHKRGNAELLHDIDTRYQRIRQHIRRYGRGGEEVLRVAWQTLRRGYVRGRWSRVGLEDLWTHALQEGRALFAQPRHRLWGTTHAQETGDMLGQTTVGPWQMTWKNVRDRFGHSHGIGKHWSDARILAYCRQHPHVQAAMIADYIQQSYEQYGQRSPYAIQNYFWLEGYLRRWIGLAAWHVSVLPRRPVGGWRKLTPGMKANTGFYAKQIILGTPHHPYGLLYWLWISRDATTIRQILQNWHNQPRMQWDSTKQMAILTPQQGNFAIRPRDIRYVRVHHRRFWRFLGQKIRILGKYRKISR